MRTLILFQFLIWHLKLIVHVPISKDLEESDKLDEDFLHIITTQIKMLLITGEKKVKY